MTFNLQDPTDVAADVLHEALLTASVRSTHGAGAFAFASSGGVRLLLDDPIFSGFVRHNTFTLIIGIDAVTNLPALDALTAAAERAAGLRIRVFLHAYHGALFHPKVSWFRDVDGATVIAGSGNLTIGGLRNNWEAFMQSRLNAEEADQLERRWDDWLTRHSSSLYDPDDPIVREQAARNTGREYHRSGTRPSTRQQPIAHQPHNVLIAEIPRNTGTLRQANFHRATFVGFFGARAGGERRVLLQHVDASVIEPPRPAIVTQSRNYRFELAAGQHVPYPEDAAGRPIGVFVREPGRLFRYELVLPGQTGYSDLQRFLDQEVGPSSARMRDIHVDLTTLARAWPGNPFSRLYISDDASTTVTDV